MIIQKNQFSGMPVLLFVFIFTSQAHPSFGNSDFTVYNKINTSPLTRTALSSLSE
ncbi:MAG: hypothetical protein IPN73_03455 [Saprospiraceae bacterium]|nr:hypothetical protein [Saprospiraceae bacterium]